MNYLKKNPQIKRQHIYLAPDSLDRLNQLSKKTGQSKSALVRSLLMGATLREMPPADYHRMTIALHAIGNNINQLARAVNAGEQMDKELYIDYAAELNRAIAEIKLAVMNR